MNDFQETPPKNIDEAQKLAFEKVRFNGSPEEISKQIKSVIALALEESIKLPEEREGVAAFFVFGLPEDSHLLPLFEKELFNQLVKHHNQNDTEKEYVDPLLLMAIDPIYSSLSTIKLKCTWK